MFSQVLKYALHELFKGQSQKLVMWLTKSIWLYAVPKYVRIHFKSKVKLQIKIKNVHQIWAFIMNYWLKGSYKNEVRPFAYNKLFCLYYSCVSITIFTQLVVESSDSWVYIKLYYFHTNNMFICYINVMQSLSVLK